MRYSRILAAILFAGFSGCVDSTAPAPAAPSRTAVLSQLFLNPNALLMAVGDSIQLNATGTNIYGDTLPVGAPVKWESSDSVIASVDATGLVRALRTTGNDLFVNITGTWTVGGAKATATAVVNVTPTRLPIAGIRFVPKDSTRSSGVDGFNYVCFNVVAVNAAGDSVASPRFPIEIPGNLTLTQVSPIYVGFLGILLCGRPYVIISTHIGDYWLKAQPTVYGALLRDSVKYTGLYPASTTISITRDSASTKLISVQTGMNMLVQPCGTVYFKNESQVPLAIEFDDPSKATGCSPFDPTGNIATIGPNQTEGRKFRAPGTAQWTVRNRDTGELLAVSGKVTMREP